MGAETKGPGRVCYVCGETKPLTEFHRDARDPEGRQRRCKSCGRGAARTWERENRALVNERNRRWREEHPGANAEASAKWARENRMKKAVYRAVQRALNNGTLVRPDACQECGVKCKPEAHHEDYEKRLEVDWLCAGCHGKRHREENAA